MTLVGVGVGVGVGGHDSGRGCGGFRGDFGEASVAGPGGLRVLGGWGLFGPPPDLVDGLVDVLVGFGLRGVSGVWGEGWSCPARHVPCPDRRGYGRIIARRAAAVVEEAWFGGAWASWAWLGAWSGTWAGLRVGCRPLDGGLRRHGACRREDCACHVIVGGVRGYPHALVWAWAS